MAMFDEVRFPTDISKSSRVGVRLSTTVIAKKNADEQRNANWADFLFFFNAKYAIKKHPQLQAVQDFFIARRAKKYGFRFQNLLDFVALNQPVGPLVTVNSVTTVQLLRRYVAGARSKDKNIVKPIAPITMRESLANFAGFTLDDTTGIVTLTSFAATLNYTGYTLDSNPTTFTTDAPHNLSIGDQHIVNGSFNGVLDGAQVVSGVPSATEFDIAVLGPSTTAAGTIDVPFQDPNFPGSFDWSGQFDIPVRFTMDEFKPSLDAFEMGNIPDIPMQETRDF